MTSIPDLSVVIPLFDESENVEALVGGIQNALPDLLSWELILVDDGSEDHTADRVHELATLDRRVRLIRLARRYGQSTAMQAGFDHALGRIVVTMDGDLQNDPRDIPSLLAKLDEGFDLVAGYRVRRKDKLVSRKVPSWVANRIIRGITGVPIRDNGCSLKAYRAPLLDRMRLYSDMHRFIPALAAGTAGARITEVPVRHHPRTRGTSKYGLSRVTLVLIDLITVSMIRSFRNRPMRLFSIAAGFASVLGLLSVGAEIVAVLTFQEYKAISLVFPGIAVLWFVLAAFLLLLGLVGEVAVQAGYVEGENTKPLVREVSL